MKALVETTKDLRGALVAADVVDNFFRLPTPEQDRFLDWIAKAQDDDAHWRRIDILVLAMRMAPPAKPSNLAPPAAPEVFG